MRKLYLFVLLVFISSTYSFAQQDPEAKKILDKFSEKTKSYSAYQADFTIVSENHQNGDNQENKGTILIKGSKYKMSINKTDVYFDGKDIYNYTVSANEVSISKPGKKKEEFSLSDPSKLFNLYTKDYKFRLLGSATEKGRDCHEIDLYPNDLKKKYSIIKLMIDKEKLELVKAKVIMKSGVHYTLKIDSFNSKANAADKDFSFDIKSHKGIEVVDLR